MEYLDKLIKEALEELKNNKQDEFDDLGDLEDEFTLSDDELEQLKAQEQPAQGTKKGERGAAFKNSDRECAIKKASDNALYNLRHNLPASSFLGKMWDTSASIKYPDKLGNGKDPLTPDMFGRIKAQVVGPTKVNAYKFPIIVVSLYNIDPEDCKQIYIQFSQTGHTERVNVPKTRKNYGLDGVSFIIASENINTWIEDDAQQIINFLSSIKDENGNMRYFKDEQEIQNLKDTITNRCVSGEDIAELINTANKNNIEMFNAFIEAENDEEVAEYIKLYSRNNLINHLCVQLGLPVSFGKILSMQNAALVLGSGKMTGAGVRPTFILTERQWIEHFGRRVNPSAVPFFIFVPFKKHRVNKYREQAFTSKPYELVDKDGNKHTISSTSDVLNAMYFGKKWHELTSQQKIAAAQMCNYINPSSCYMVQEFDVSDTTPTDPTNDKFEQEIGLLNRFTGEMNAAASEFVKQQNLLGNETKKEDNEEENKENNISTEQIIASKINKLALTNVDEYCNYNGIPYTKVNDDDSRSIINALMNIAKKFIPLRKQENIDILAGDAVYIICKIYKIALDLVQTIHRGTPSNEIEYNQCVNAVMNLARVVDGSWKETIKKDKNSTPSTIVSEDINNNDVQSNIGFKIYTDDQLKRFAFKMLGLTESRYNTFNEFKTLLERMDNSKNNLHY